MEVYSGLKGLFMLGKEGGGLVFLADWRVVGYWERWNEDLPDVRPMGEDVLVEVAPGDLGDPACSALVSSV